MDRSPPCCAGLSVAVPRVTSVIGRVVEAAIVVAVVVVAKTSRATSAEGMPLATSPEGVGAADVRAAHATDTPTCKPAANMGATTTEAATHMAATATESAATEAAAVATATESAAAVAATTTTTTTSQGVGRNGGCS
jgi:hypothetical protein